MKFVYCRLKINSLDSMFSDTLDDKMNALGEQGWECYAVEWSQPVTIGFLGIFSTTKLHKERVFYFRKSVPDSL